MPTLREVRELARFSARMAPQFLRRVAADFKRPIAAAPARPHSAQWSPQGLHAAWIGHSTVLLSIDGFSILTDPVFSARVGIGIGPLTLGMKRLVQPACLPRDFRPPDLILLSHAHMDHFDLPSLRRLEHAGSTVITATRTADLLRVKRYREVRELGWNQQARVGPATVRAFEVKHWGARMRNDTFRGYNGYLIECGRYRVVFGGDTAYTESFRQLRSARPVDLAIMPVGAYDPWIGAHCNPEQAWAMANHAGAEYVLPVHHRTFELSREPREEPLERLLTAAGAAPERVCVRHIGQEFHLAA